jgi:hypothetical protein
MLLMLIDGTACVRVRRVLCRMMRTPHLLLLLDKTTRHRRKPRRLSTTTTRKAQRMNPRSPMVRIRQARTSLRSVAHRLPSSH